MVNDNIMGIGVNPCINGITQKQSADIKSIPLLDERITALEQGGSGGGGSWKKITINAENINKYFPKNQDGSRTALKTSLIVFENLQFVDFSAAVHDSYCFIPENRIINNGDNGLLISQFSTSISTNSPESIYFYYIYLFVKDILDQLENATGDESEISSGEYGSIRLTRKSVTNVEWYAEISSITADIGEAQANQFSIYVFE